MSLTELANAARAVTIQAKEYKVRSLTLEQLAAIEQAIKDRIKAQAMVDMRTAPSDGIKAIIWNAAEERANKVLVLGGSEEAQSQLQRLDAMTDMAWFAMVEDQPEITRREVIELLSSATEEERTALFSAFAPNPKN